MGWDSTKPISATNIIDIPSIFQANWAEMENILGEQHYTMTSSLSGRHKPGLTGWLSATTTSGITAISSPITGALALDTTIGILKRYDATAGWVQMNMDPLSRVLVYRNADYTLAIGTSATIPFDTETIDTLSEYNTSTYTFQTSASGYYLVTSKLNITPTAASTEITMYANQTNSSNILKYQGTVTRVSPSTDELSIYGQWMINMGTSDKLYITVYHNYTSAIILEGGADKSYLKIHRIS